MIIQNTVNELKKHLLTDGISFDVLEDANGILKSILSVYPELLNLEDFKNIFIDNWYAVAVEYQDTKVGINAPTFFCIDESNQFFILVSMTKEMITMSDNFNRFIKVILLISEKIKELSNIEFKYIVVDTNVDGFACVSHDLPLRYLTGTETYH